MDLKVLLKHLVIIVSILLLTSYSEYHIKSNSSSDIIISNNFTFLDNSNQLLQSSSQFSQVKAFRPDSLDYKSINNEKLPYIKLLNGEESISGTIILENKDSKNMEIQSIFLQGNIISNVKLKHTNEWQKSIEYTVPPMSSVKIAVDIQWIDKGENELVFFPLDHSAPLDRYNGTNLSTFRYYVSNKNFTINKNMLVNQTVKIDNAEISKMKDFFPTPVWISSEGKEVDYIVNKDKLLTLESIVGLQLQTVPYDTKVDVLLINDDLSTQILNEGVDVTAHKPTYVYLEKRVLDKLEKSKNKNYLLILNNRGTEMIYDLEGVSLGMKPFSTTFQSILEYYKTN